jgi:hypothetical protein
MNDGKVLLAVLVVVLGMGFRLELGPAKVVAGKDPVQAVVARKLKDGKKARAGAAGSNGAATVMDKAALKKERASGGDMDESTDKALREIEDRNAGVVKKLKGLPFVGGGGEDDEDEDEDEAPAAEGAAKP